MRYEFLPLYNTVTQAACCVELRDVVSYTKTFILPYANSFTEINTTVLFSFKPTKIEKGASLDALIALCHSAPGLKLKFLFDFTLGLNCLVPEGENFGIEPMIHPPPSSPWRAC
jgi:hypothetical protein